MADLRDAQRGQHTSIMTSLFSNLWSYCGTWSSLVSEDYLSKIETSAFSSATVATTILCTSGGAPTLPAWKLNLLPDASILSTKSVPMLLWDVDAANTSTHSMGLKKQEFTGLAISTKSTIYIRDSDDIILCAEPLLIDPKLVTNLDFKFSQITSQIISPTKGPFDTENVGIEEIKSSSSNQPASTFPTPVKLNPAIARIMGKSRTPNKLMRKCKKDAENQRTLAKMEQSLQPPSNFLANDYLVRESERAAHQQEASSSTSQFSLDGTKIINSPKTPFSVNGVGSLPFEEGIVLKAPQNSPAKEHEILEGEQQISKVFVSQPRVENLSVMEHTGKESLLNENINSSIEDTTKISSTEDVGITVLCVPHQELIPPLELSETSKCQVHKQGNKKVLENVLQPELKTPVTFSKDSVKREVLKAPLEISPARGDEIAAAEKRMKEYLEKKNLLSRMLPTQVQSTTASLNKKTGTFAAYENQAQEYKSEQAECSKLTNTSHSSSPLRTFSFENKMDISPARENEIAAAEKRMKDYLEKKNLVSPLVPAYATQAQPTIVSIIEKTAAFGLPSGIEFASERGVICTQDKNSSLLKTHMSKSKMEISPARGDEIAAAERRMKEYLQKKNISSPLVPAFQAQPTAANLNEKTVTFGVTEGFDLVDGRAVVGPETHPQEYKTRQIGSSTVSTSIESSSPMKTSLFENKMEISPARGDEIAAAEKRMKEYLEKKKLLAPLVPTFASQAQPTIVSIIEKTDAFSLPRGIEIANAEVSTPVKLSEISSLLRPYCSERKMQIESGEGYQIVTAQKPTTEDLENNYVGSQLMSLPTSQACSTSSRICTTRKTFSSDTSTRIYPTTLEHLPANSKSVQVPVTKDNHVLVVSSKTTSTVRSSFSEQENDENKENQHDPKLLSLARTPLALSKFDSSREKTASKPLEISPARSDEIAMAEKRMKEYLEKKKCLVKPVSIVPSTSTNATSKPVSAEENNIKLGSTGKSTTLHISSQNLQSSHTTDCVVNHRNPSEYNNGGTKGMSLSQTLPQTPIALSSVVESVEVISCKVSTEISPAKADELVAAEKRMKEFLEKKKNAKQRFPIPKAVNSSGNSTRSIVIEETNTVKTELNARKAAEINLQITKPPISTIPVVQPSTPSSTRKILVSNVKLPAILQSKDEYIASQKLMQDLREKTQNLAKQLSIISAQASRKSSDEVIHGKTGEMEKRRQTYGTIPSQIIPTSSQISNTSSKVSSLVSHGRTKLKNTTTTKIPSGVNKNGLHANTCRDPTFQRSNHKARDLKPSDGKWLERNMAQLFGRYVPLKQSSHNSTSGVVECSNEKSDIAPVDACTSSNPETEKPSDGSGFRIISIFDHSTKTIHFPL
eukprot:NP_510401.3 Uncharacterized protein CELE_F23D12.2 [Caenorhabditis elegans]